MFTLHSHVSHGGINGKKASLNGTTVAHARMQAACNAVEPIRHDDAKAQHFHALMRQWQQKVLHLLGVAFIMRPQESSHVDLEKRLCQRSPINNTFSPHPASSASGGFLIPAFWPASTSSSIGQAVDLPAFLFSGSTQNHSSQTAARHWTFDIRFIRARCIFSSAS